MNGIAKRIVSLLLATCISFCFVGCSLKDARKTVEKTAGKAKDTVANWYASLDFSKFQEGWDYSVEFLGAQYSAAMSTEYVANVQSAITTLKTDMNAAAGSARGTAQEAGFLAEEWATDTFNINAQASGSSYSAETVGSTDLGSVDVTTTYGENASLKYYQDANGSASAQAKSILKAYYEYRNSSNNPMGLKEYLDKNGYEPGLEHDELYASIYEGQTRIIPSDQMPEATKYLQGKIDKLSAVEGDTISAQTKAYQETLANLKDRLSAPDGTESKPLTYEELQAIAEVSKDGEFKPEDFGIELSTVISPKYVVKQAIGTGLEVGTINAVLTAGPDIYSIFREAAENGDLDETALKEEGFEAFVAGSEGFIEGSVCQAVTTMCQTGTFGSALKDANPSVVATLTVLVIEAAIHGYELSQGSITAEEYGNIMVDRAMVMFLALPTTALFLAILPASHLAMMAGCMAGGLAASIGYLVAKDAVMDIVDGGGFEAVIPVQTVETASIAKDKISSLKINEQASTFKDSIISTASDGYIKITSLGKKK